MTKSTSLRLAEVVAALSQATDLGMGHPHNEVMRYNSGNNFK